MNNTYTYPKDLGFEKEAIEVIKIGFDNGECLHLSGKNVVALEFDYYDRLVFTNAGICPFVHSGYLKLRLKGAKIPRDLDGTRVIDGYSYRKSQIDYATDRLISKGGITSLVFCLDNFTWGTRIMGNFNAKKDGKYIIIEARPKPFDEPYKSKLFSIDLPPIVKEDVFRITLNFENFDVVTVYQDDIKEIELKMPEQLVEAPNDNLQREIIGGHMVGTAKEVRSISL